MLVGTRSVDVWAFPPQVTYASGGGKSCEGALKEVHPCNKPGPNGKCGSSPVDFTFSPKVIFVPTITHIFPHVCPDIASLTHLMRISHLILCFVSVY